MNAPIRILIVDDHPIVRAGLKALVSTEKEMEIAGEAADGKEAVKKARSLNPDLILLDMVLPEMDGLDVIRLIKRERSEINILVLTSFCEYQMVFSAIKAGAMGYLLKDSPPRQLIRAIYEVSKGESSLHPVIARMLVKEIRKKQGPDPSDFELTKTEMEVLKLIAVGLRNREIAEKLFVSERTVRTHVSHILSKLHLGNRTQAALYAIRKGLADLHNETTIRSVENRFPR